MSKQNPYKKNDTEYYKHFGGGLYKIFLKQMTYEKARLISEVKNDGDNLRIRQIKNYKKRVDLITQLQRLYSIKTKKDSRKSNQIARVFLRYNIK